MTSEEWRQVVSTGKESAGRRFRVRWLSLILAVGLIVLSVVTSLVGRRVVSDQEDRQVRQRTSEIASVLDGAVTNIEGNLRSLGAVFRVAPDAFDQAARDAVEAKQFAAVGVVKREGSTFRIQRAAGPGLAPGSEIVPEAVPALMQAATTPRSVWTKVFMRGDERRLGAVIAFPNQPDTYGYEESVLQPPQQSAITASQPFGELIVALYSSDRPDPDQLLAATSTKVPLTDAHSEPYTAGSSQWLLVVKARGPLAGSHTRALPWILFGGGLLTTILVVLLVESLQRRREYAMVLVRQRTRQLEAAQNQLVQSERLAAIGEFAAAVGHELRNPLGVVSNALYLLQTRLDRDDDFLTRQLNTAERHVSSATLIVSDLLEFARPRDPMREEVDLVDLVDEVASTSPPPEGIELVRQVPRDLPRLSADRDQLRQVVLNLLINSYEAMGTGGRVTITAASRDGGVELSVDDNGPGMDDETSSQVFEPFFTKKARGIGLGLAVTRRIVEAHGGTIGVRSETGAGATFTVVMPVDAAPAGETA